MTEDIAAQDDIRTQLSRRKMFGVCSVGLFGSVALAACGGDDSTSTTGAGAPSEAGSEAVATTTADSTPAATKLIKLADVPVGGSAALEVAGKPVIVSQPSAGEAVAFSAVCPHQFATVVVKGKELRCPLHGSTFDAATGKNLTGPAAGKPLPPVEVKVVGGEVVQG